MYYFSFIFLLIYKSMFYVVRDGSHHELVKFILLKTFGCTGGQGFLV